MSEGPPATFYEFFAGGGMARLGLGNGWTCRFANDFDPIKTATYRSNFADAAEHLHEGDIWNLDKSDLPGRADLAWASSPCQDFSLAGKRAGLRGNRSSAFFGFWHLIEQLNADDRAPYTLVVENVLGLLTSHAGADFKALCAAFAKEGYRFGALEIDAARFVPQSRPRLFVIATKCPVPNSLAGLEPTLPFHSDRVRSAFEGLDAKLQDEWIWWHLDFPPAHNESIDQLLEPDDQVQWFSDERKALLLSRLAERHKAKLKMAQSRKTRVVGTVFRRMRKEDGKKIQRAELRFDGFAGCLRTPGGGSSTQFIVVVDGDDVRVRKLSPRESARLMGINDDYTLPLRPSSALKVTGDGVAVPVVDFLARGILAPLTSRGDLTDWQGLEREKVGG